MKFYNREKEIAELVRIQELHSLKIVWKICKWYCISSLLSVFLVPL